MKRSILISVLILCLLFSSCEWLEPSPETYETQGQTSEPANATGQDKDDENENNGVQNGIMATSEDKRFGVTSYDEMKMPAYEEYCSFYSDTHYYYVFYLGCVDHVPLQDNAVVYEYTGNKYTKEFTTTETNSSLVTDMVSVVEATSVTKNFDVSGEVEFPIKAVEIEIGLSYSHSKTQEVSSARSVEKAVEYSKSHSETTTFTFDETCRKGFYRYVLFGDVDVFGVLIKEISTGNYTTDIYEVISAQYYGLDYSETSRFNATSHDKLYFAPSLHMLESLGRPNLYIGDHAQDIPKEEESRGEITASVNYDSGYNEKKVEASDKLTQVYDVIDLQPLSSYLTSEYTLHFKVEIYMKERYSGVQEIYLCKDDMTHVAGVSDYEYGGSGDPNKEYMWIPFYWDVNGSDCSSVMKLEYGAHGNYADDWYRAHVKVTVTVTYN